MSQIFEIGRLTAFAIPAGSLLVSAAIGYIVSRLLLHIIGKWDDRVDFGLGEPLFKVSKWRGPINMLLPALFVSVVLPATNLPDSIMAVIRHLLSLWMISAVAFLFTRLVGALREVVLSKFELGTKDNLAARKAHTQLRVIERIVIFAIMVIAIATILMTFDKVKQIGMSLLASAGVFGIIVGFAAQRSIATIVAGVQIAWTQPIRLDDVVIVEGEWGRIEEITLTYVVVRIWDLRRLVLPVTYFIEKPFQNWTRISADILGTVFIYTDYNVPVDVLRGELKRLLEASGELWDGKVCGVQVTDAKQATVEIRALMSSEDASKNWDLRCMVREKLLDFLRREYPESLPRMRVEMGKQNG